MYYLDIDECTRGTAGCSQGCRNTDGSFICTCNEGYQTHHDDPTFCVGMIYNFTIMHNWPWLSSISMDKILSAYSQMADVIIFVTMTLAVTSVCVIVATH